MPNTINFPLTVYVQIGFIETEVITCAVIDTGSEITLIKSFLWNKWKKLDKSLTKKESLENPVLNNMNKTC